MTMREEIVAKINNLPDGVLVDVLEFVHLVEGRRKPSLMEYLRSIKIDGPPDLSRNFDLYASGAKDFDENPD